MANSEKISAREFFVKLILFTYKFFQNCHRILIKTSKAYGNHNGDMSIFHFYIMYRQNTSNICLSSTKLRVKWKISREQHAQERNPCGCIRNQNSRTTKYNINRQPKKKAYFFVCPLKVGLLSSSARVEAYKVYLIEVLMT